MTHMRRRAIAALALATVLFAGCGGPGRGVSSHVPSNGSFTEYVDGQPLRCALFRLPNDAGSNAALTCDWSEYDR